MKIIIPLVCALFLVACNDTASTQEAPAAQESNPIVQDVNTTSAEHPKEVVEQTTQVTTTVTQVEAVKTEVKPVDQVKAEPKKPSIEKVVKVVKEEVKPKVEVQATHAQINGGTLYGEKCASCHGAKAEKPALGKSQVIAGWSASQVQEALHGYQSGSYGKEMKALMQGQAKSLSSEEIKALAKYISTL